MYKNITASTVIENKPGVVSGFIVNSHSSGTLALIDGTEGTSVAASSVLTSSGAMVPAAHATNRVTSTGAMVAGSHATTVFTKSSGNFLDATKASAILTSDQTQPTAGKVVVLGDITYTFTALGGTSVNGATAVNVPLGNNTAETMNNLYNAFLVNPLVDTVRTSTYVITVTAKTAGTAGNSIAATEDDSHLDWDGSNTTLTGGTAAETITIGSKVYTFKDTLNTAGSATAIQVKIGASATLSLANLRKAINATGTPGLEYSFGGTADANVVASASDATTVTLWGRVAGTSLNTVATTETVANGSFPDTTLGGGTGASDAGVTTGAATVTIGAITYTAVVELSETQGATAVPYEVLYGGSVAVFLDNLKLAVNGIGTAGTTYGTGTVAHPDVIATTNSDTVQIFWSRTVGDDTETTRLNAIVTTETIANFSWADTTLGGGTGTSDPAVTTAGAQFIINGRTYTAVVELNETLGATAVVDQIKWVTSEAVFLDNVKKAINLTGTAGTDYSTGTTINADVIATTNTNTQQTIVSKLLGTVGNAITTTTNIANYAWTSTVLTSGAGATGSVIMNTFTFPTGSSMQVLPALGDKIGGIPFDRALSAVVGGTSADVTIVYQ
jgi:hypothetical protein